MVNSYVVLGYFLITLFRYPMPTIPYGFAMLH